MIAVDTNILVYAHRRDSAWHTAAAKCVRELAEASASWMIPWSCLHEFLAIVTHPRIYDPPSTLDAASRQIEYWLASPSLVVAHETPQHWDTLRQLVTKTKIMGPVVHDARVAAICLDHGVDALWSADRDFSRFGELTVRNPLAH